MLRRRDRREGLDPGAAGMQACMPSAWADGSPLLAAACSASTLAFAVSSSTTRCLHNPTLQLLQRHGSASVCQNSATNSEQSHCSLPPSTMPAVARRKLRQASTRGASSVANSSHSSGVSTQQSRWNCGACRGALACGSARSAAQ